MKIVGMFLAAVAVASGLFFVSGVGHAEGIFKYNGKTYSSSDLEPAAQQNLHDLQVEHFMRTEAFAEQVMIDLWLEDQAKAKSKSKEEVEADVFKTSEPTQKDVETWYESNKNRLPPGYKLEQIANDVKTLLAGEAKKLARQKVIEDLKKKGSYALLLKEPDAPSFKIDTEGYPSLGSDKASIVITEFADYQCPHCKAAKENLVKVMKKFEGKVRLVYIDFPINPSGISLEVAHGAYCAGKLGKYWEYHDLAFEKQKTLDKNSPSALATEIKLDDKKFAECLQSEEPKKFVERSKKEAERIGISGTPGIFLNGRKVKGYEEKDLTEEIQKMLTGKPS